MSQHLKVVKTEKTPSVRILGNTKQIMYGREVNLEDYTEDKIRKQVGGTFSHIEFFDLDQLGPNWKNNKNLWNLGVRADQNDRDHIDDLKTSFKTDGFKTDYPLPCYGTDGKFRDGRSRVIGIKEDKERVIPVAVYEYEKESNKAFITNGLISNNHPPAKRVTVKDVEQAGTNLTISGDLDPDDDSILNWMINEVNFSSISSNTSVLTRTKNKIRKNYNDNVNLGTGIVRTQKRELWIEWLAQNGYDVSNDENTKSEYYLYTVDQDSYWKRCFANMIMNVDYIYDDDNEIVNPYKIILYTGQTNPSKAIESMIEFQNKLETLYKRAHKMSGSFARKGRPWEFVGAIPQIEGRHITDGNNLVPLDQY